MKTHTHPRLLAALLAAAALAIPSTLLAQGMIDTGRSNDASNRLGSGGRNTPTVDYRSYSNGIVNSGNRIVTGNVTMGREFRDNVGYTDPYAFRGNMPSAGLDSFYRNSVGVPQPYAPEQTPNVSTPFYGAQRTVQQPAGTVLNPQQGGYVPAPTVTGTRGLYDQRLGIVDLNQPLTPGQMVTRGSLTPQGGQGIIIGSTLYGFRQWNPDDPADRQFLENILNRQNTAFDRLHLSPEQIRKMRDELNRVIENEPQGKAINTKVPDALTLNPMVRTMESPADPGVATKAINDQLNANPLGGGMNTGAGMRQYVLGAARKTSTQYAELNKRLEQYYADRGKTDADFAREFNAALRAKQEAERRKVAGNKNPNEVNPNVPKVPDKNPVEDPTKPKKKPQPVKINTLAAGVKAEGLANLLKKAEGLLKEGKYASALDQYDAAEQVAPNNPMIWLGRANAELGAGFFKRSDTHLRQAFMTDKALLMGQYDLTGMLGEERLGKIVAELKDIANKNNNDAMPVFLLSYIAYNTGHERQAAGYLDLAEKRSEGKDLFLKMVKEHWALPDDQASPDSKKPEKPEQNK